jgi:hypothetical protein
MVCLTVSSLPVESAAPAQNGTAGEGEAVVAFEQILEGPLAEFMMYARRIESNILIEQCELVVKGTKLSCHSFHHRRTAWGFQRGRRRLLAACPTGGLPSKRP